MLRQSHPQSLTNSRFFTASATSEALHTAGHRQIPSLPSRLAIFGGRKGRWKEGEKRKSASASYQRDGLLDTY